MGSCAGTLGIPRCLHPTRSLCQANDEEKKGSGVGEPMSPPHSADSLSPHSVTESVCHLGASFPQHCREEVSVSGLCWLAVLSSWAEEAACEDLKELPF